MICLKKLFEKFYAEKRFHKVFCGNVYKFELGKNGVCSNSLSTICKYMDASWAYIYFFVSVFFDKYLRVTGKQRKGGDKVCGVKKFDCKIAVCRKACAEGITL